MGGNTERFRRAFKPSKGIAIFALSVGAVALFEKVVRRNMNMWFEDGD